MARKVTLSMVCARFLLVFACGTLVAQSQKPQRIHNVHSSKSVIPAEDINAALKTIFTNLGPTKTNFYNSHTGGDLVAGPTNSGGYSEQWIGIPFTPKQNAHVSQLQAALGYVSGTSLVNLGLYSDASGAVGTLLAQGSSTSIPTDGTCCQVVTVTIASTAVIAGTQYWIVATPDDVNAPSLFAIWQPSNTANYGFNDAQAGWSTSSNVWPAGAAAGTIP